MAVYRLYFTQNEGNIVTVSENSPLIEVAVDLDNLPTAQLQINSIDVVSNVFTEEDVFGKYFHLFSYELPSADHPEGQYIYNQTQHDQFVSDLGIIKNERNDFYSSRLRAISNNEASSNDRFRAIKEVLEKQLEEQGIELTI